MRAFVEAVERQARQSTCALWFKPDHGGEVVGTGTLVTAGSRRFILTSHHVMAGFLHASESHAAFSNDLRLQKAHLQAFRSDEEDDIALIEVDTDQVPRGTVPRSAGEFCIVRDFREFPVADTGFVFVGMPGEEFVVVDSPERVFRPLTYGTVEHDSIRVFENRLFVRFGRGLESPFPAPHRLSGSLVVALRLTGKRADEARTPGAVIAMQYATWDQSNDYLRCTTLRKLPEWLPEAPWGVFRPENWQCCCPSFSRAAK